MAHWTQEVAFYRLCDFCIDLEKLIQSVPERFIFISEALQILRHGPTQLEGDEDLISYWHDRIRDLEPSYNGAREEWQGFLDDFYGLELGEE